MSIPARSGLLVSGALLFGWLAPWQAFWPGFRPDLPLLAVLILATRYPRDQAVLWGAGVGCLADVLGAEPFGSRGIVLALVAWLGGAAAQRLQAEALPARLLLLTIGLLWAEAMSRLVGHLASPGVETPAVHGLLARLAATLLMAALLWRALPRHSGAVA